MDVVQDYKTQLSGRCHRCNIRFIWDKRGRDGRPKRLADALCPVCGSQLHQTTHLFKGITRTDMVPRKKQQVRL